MKKWKVEDWGRARDYNKVIRDEIDKLEGTYDTMPSKAFDDLIDIIEKAKIKIIN